jgi:hypothetical protein
MPPQPDTQRRELLKVLGATAAIGVLPGCAAESTTALPERLPVAPSLDLSTVDGLDEFLLVRDVTQFYSDVVRDAQAASGQRGDAYVNTGAQLFGRAQAMLRTHYPTGLTYAFADAPQSDAYPEIRRLTLSVSPGTAVFNDLRRVGVGTAGTTPAAIGPSEVLDLLWASLGVSDFRYALLKVIPSRLQVDLATGLRRLDWALLSRTIGRILAFTLTLEFYVALVIEIGKVKAARVVASIAARFLPFIGWVIVVGSVIAKLAQLLFR